MIATKTPLETEALVKSMDPVEADENNVSTDVEKTATENTAVVEAKAVTASLPIAIAQPVEPTENTDTENADRDETTVTEVAETVSTTEDASSETTLDTNGLSINKSVDLSTVNDDEASPFGDMASTAPVQPYRRSVEEIMEQEGVELLEATEIFADEEAEFNFNLAGMYEKSRLEKEAKDREAKKVLDALEATATKRERHRIMWLRATWTSIIVSALCWITFVIVGLL